MPLVVETGSGSASSEAYASVAAFKAYCDGRGIAYPTDDAVIEQRIRLGADYLGTVYREAWAGNRMYAIQALDWPRANVVMRDGPGWGQDLPFYPFDKVPIAVVNANIEAALRAASGPLIPDLTQAVRRERVGPVEVEYQDYSRATRSYRAIDALLAPLLAASGGLRVVRG